MQQVTLLKVNPAGNALRETRLVEGVLSSLPLFRGVEPLRLQQLAGQCRAQYARRSERLCEQGEPMAGVFAVAYGMLKLALGRPGCEERVVRFVRAGQSFGEASALLGRASPVHAVALEESMLAFVPAAALLRLQREDPTFARNLASVLAERSLELLGELAASVQQSSLQRLAGYLHSLAARGMHDDRWVAQLPATKTAVAARLGVKKETLSRLLHALAVRGIVEVRGRDVAILDRNGLQALAGGPA